MNPLEELLQSPESGLLRMDRLIAETPEDAKRILLAAICNNLENSELRAGALFILWTRGKELGSLRQIPYFGFWLKFLTRNSPNQFAKLSGTIFFKVNVPPRLISLSNSHLHLHPDPGRFQTHLRCEYKTRLRIHHLLFRWA